MKLILSIRIFMVVAFLLSTAHCKVMLKLFKLVNAANGSKLCSADEPVQVNVARSATQCCAFCSAMETGCIGVNWMKDLRQCEMFKSLTQNTVVEDNCQHFQVIYRLGWQHFEQRLFRQHWLMYY